MEQFHATGAVGTTALILLGLWFLFGAQFVGRIASGKSREQKVTSRDENLYASLGMLRATGVQDRVGGIPVPERGEMVWHDVIEGVVVESVDTLA